jgi:hypothetical protein
MALAQLAAFSYSKIIIPRDEEGYTHSFTDPDSSEAREWFMTYGFVVLRDALSAVECKATEDEVWDYVESEGFLRPGEPCFFGKLSCAEKQHIPFMCGANGRRDKGMCVEGVLREANSKNIETGIIAVIAETSGLDELIKLALQQGAAAIVIVRSSDILEELPPHMEKDSMTIPIVIVRQMDQRLLEMGKTCKLHIDSDGTWTFPTLPAPHTFFVGDLELGVKSKTCGKVSRKDTSTWTEECGWEVDEEVSHVS